MFSEPYQTSLLRGYPVKKLTDQLEVHFIHENLKPVSLHMRDGSTDEELNGAVYEIDPGTKDIDPLLAPLMIETRQGKKVVIDSRATKRERRDGPPVISAPADHRFALREAVLTYLWAVEGPEHFSQLGILPIRVYARWLSEGITRRLALDPLDQLRISIMAAFYYMSSFRDMSGEDSDTVKLGFANLISRALSVSVEEVLKRIMPVGQLTDLNSLITAIKDADGASVRMESLNVGLVYTVMGSCWYGAHAKNIVARSMEYPPTFLTMLMTAFSDRTYHSSYFAKTAMNADKQSLSREFILAMNHLSRGLTDE
jgi:hypothetical protein